MTTSDTAVLFRVWPRQASPVGAVVCQEGDLAEVSPWKFSTKYFDAETGLGYWGMRWYSTEINRWLSLDPGGTWDGLNIYAFVGSDPVNASDPLGLNALECKQCGVQAYLVQWSPGLNSAYQGSLLHIDVFILFKKDDMHDPYWCGYEQWVTAEWVIIAGPHAGDQYHGGQPLFRDTYSRASDLDGNRDPSDPSFFTNDDPGVGGLSDDDFINYAFTAEQRAPFLRS